MTRGRIVATLDRPSVALALSAATILLPVLFVVALQQPLDQPVGKDAALYLDAAGRWLAGGPFYEPRQLAGPYEVAHGDILYPPVGLANVQMKPAWDFMAGGNGRTSHTEWFRSSIGQVNLTWEQLSAPFMVEFMKEQSATGAHEMFSLFLESSAVRATINGKGVAGKPFPRDWAGRKSTTAFLAFSETWIKA